MFMWIAASLILAGTAFWMMQRRRAAALSPRGGSALDYRAPAAAAKKAQPTVYCGRGGRVCNPQLQGPHISRVWRLESHGCVCGARHLAGRIFDISETFPVPFEGRVDCRCHWVPLKDMRRGVRRSGDDRREQFRMVAGRSDRRVQHERRNLRTAWTDNTR